MRIDLPLCDFQNCRKRFDGNCTDSHYETCEYKQMKDKEYKYRWHKLYEDETDLPSVSDYYFVAYESPYGINYGYIIYQVISVDGIGKWDIDKKVIAWRENGLLDIDGYGVYSGKVIYF